MLDYTTKKFLEICKVVINCKGVSIPPTVKVGYILPYAPDFVTVLATVSGDPARIFDFSTQDITPYGNGLYHLNSIIQPTTATDAPVAGVVIKTTSAVPGSATGPSHEVDIAAAVPFAIKMAKEFTAGKLSFFDEVEFEQLVKLYGKMNHL